jgi:hypothetical protein
MRALEWRPRLSDCPTKEFARVVCGVVAGEGSFLSFARAIRVPFGPGRPMMAQVPCQVRHAPSATRRTEAAALLGRRRAVGMKPSTGGCTWAA